jgi:hypothetical protein
LIDPDNWTIDTALLARHGVDEIMLDLRYDDIRTTGRRLPMRGSCIFRWRAADL